MTPFFCEPSYIPFLAFRGTSFIQLSVRLSLFSVFVQYTNAAVFIRPKFYDHTIARATIIIKIIIIAGRFLQFCIQESFYHSTWSLWCLILRSDGFLSCLDLDVSCYDRASLNHYHFRLSNDELS